LGLRPSGRGGLWPDSAGAPWAYGPRDAAAYWPDSAGGLGPTAVQTALGLADAAATARRQNQQSRGSRGPSRSPRLRVVLLLLRPVIATRVRIPPGQRGATSATPTSA